MIFFILFYRELLNQNADNLRIILIHTIYNELSNARNPNNMALLGVICQNSPETSARVSRFTFSIFIT